MQVQVESWPDALPELRPMFPLLWEEVAVDQDRFTAKCDEGKYAELDKAGILHLVTAREGKALVGYFLVLITPNGHYLGAGDFAFTDMYYMAPEHRKGPNALKLFTFMEKTLRDKGIVKIYTSHKLHKDRSALMKFLGYKPTDMIYSKVIG